MVQIVIATLTALLISCSPKPEEFKPLDEAPAPVGWIDYCNRNASAVHCLKK